MPVLPPGEETPGYNPPPAFPVGGFPLSTTSAKTPPAATASSVPPPAVAIAVAPTAATAKSNKHGPELAFRARPPVDERTRLAEFDKLGRRVPHRAFCRTEPEIYQSIAIRASPTGECPRTTPSNVSGTASERRTERGSLQPLNASRRAQKDRASARGLPMWGLGEDSALKKTVRRPAHAPWGRHPHVKH